jgi:hypothetical protein
MLAVSNSRLLDLGAADMLLALRHGAKRVELHFGRRLTRIRKSEYS